MFISNLTILIIVANYACAPLIDGLGHATLSATQRPTQYIEASLRVAA